MKKEYLDAAKAWSTELRAAYDEAKKNGKEKDFKFDQPSPARAVLAALPGDRRERTPKARRRSMPSR